MSRGVCIQGRTARKNPWSRSRRYRGQQSVGTVLQQSRQRSFPRITGFEERKIQKVSSDDKARSLSGDTITPFK